MVIPRPDKNCPNCGERIFLRRHDDNALRMYRCISKEERAKMGEFDDGFESDQAQKTSAYLPTLNELKPGYHLTEIKKGRIGEISKIQEELDELKDAHSQGVKVMELVELSDLIGAVEAYLEENHRGYTVEDLLEMSKVTRRAFENGHRGT